MLTQKVLSHWKLIPVSFLIRKVWNAVSFRTVVVGLKTTTGEYEIWWAKYLIPDRNGMLWVTRCVACSLHLSSWKCYVSLLESASTTVGISLWENDCVVIGEDHFQLLLWLFFDFSVCVWTVKWTLGILPWRIRGQIELRCLESCQRSKQFLLRCKYDSRIVFKSIQSPSC